MYGLTKKRISVISDTSTGSDEYTIVVSGDVERTASTQWAEDEITPGSQETTINGFVAPNGTDDYIITGKVVSVTGNVTVETTDVMVTDIGVASGVLAFITVVASVFYARS